MFAERNKLNMELDYYNSIFKESVCETAFGQKWFC